MNILYFLLLMFSFNFYLIYNIYKYNFNFYIYFTKEIKPILALEKVLKGGPELPTPLTQ